MKTMRRLVALALVVLIVIPTWITANGYATLTLKSSANVKGATYYNYSVYGSVAGNTADVNVIKFNIADDIIPMAYATSAGKVNTLNTHVQAAIADGYEVIGAINASFFDMSSGDPCSALISDGKIIFDHAEKNDSVMTAFDANGYPTLLGDASLSYSLNLNGTVISSAIGMVNKDYTACNLVDATISTRFHYYDSDAGNLSNTAQAGYEILCEKINGTDIAVGKTLQGKVLSVTYGYYGKTQVTNENQFVLFVKSSSTTYANYAKNLSAGSSISLTVTANNSWANEVLSSCHSAISSTYWLVQNGVDLTDTNSTIIHSTSLSRGWAAFGWDNNGNYYFFTSEEYGITLKDVADAMISMGATNVLRLDGGGSTTMYVDGYGLVENAASRAVCDVLLVVKKPAPDQGTSDNLASDRGYTISVTNDPVIDTEWNTDYSASLTDGVAAQTFASDGSWFAFNANKNAVNGVGSVTVNFDNLCDITQLKLNLVNQSDWGINPPTSVKAYSSMDGENYSYIGEMPLQSTDSASYWSVLDTSVRAGSVRFDFALNGVWAMVNELEVHGTETSYPFPYDGPKDNLASDRDYIISVTNDPIVDSTWNNDYSADLTDGIAAMTFNGSDGSWFAFSPSKNTIDGIGTVTINFDKICNIEKFRLSLVNESSWGVYAPTSIKVYGSNDGVDYTYIGSMPLQSTDTTSYWSELPVSNVKYGSVRFDFQLNGSFAMVNEVEVHGTATETDFHICKDTSHIWYTDSENHWRKCGTCGAVLDKSTHSFGDWYVSKEVNCNQNGEERRDCSDCGYSETKTVITSGHNYSSVVTPPTCTDRGYTTYTCGACGNSYVGNYINANGHNYSSVVTPPTCTAQGYTTYTCTCGDSYTGNYVSANGHSFGDCYVSTAVSCTSNGEEKRDCKNCNHYETKTVITSGHDYSAVVTPPTCNDRGYTTYTCETCGNSYNGNYVAANGHDYASVVTPPTCDTDGYTTYTCHCGDTYTDNIVKTEGHKFGDWYVSKEVKCTENGEEKRECGNCDYFETKTVVAQGHQYASVVTPPTCDTDGYTTYTCHCGDTYTDNIVKTEGHNFGDWYVSKEVNCTENGEKKRDCKNCDHFETETIFAQGHQYASVVTPPTCENGGYTTYTCGVCGDSYTDNLLPADGHAYSSVVTPADCENGGYTTHTCGVCGNSYTDNHISATGHDYSSVVTPATCTKEGYTTHVCGTCGDSYTDTPTPKQDHDFTDWFTVKEATADVNGQEQRDCNNCTEFEVREIPAIGHNYQPTIIPPGCTMPGYTRYYCDCCGNYYHDNYVEPKGHSYGEWTTVTPVDCENDGEEQRICLICDHTETKTISAIGHDYSSVVTAPNCENGGFTTHTCENCGDVYTDNYLPENGHSFGEWYTTKTLTCVENGEERRDCKNCNHYETNTFIAQGHDYKSVVTTPNCENGGYTTHTCSVCGDSYTDSYIPENGHDYDAVITPPDCINGGYTTYTCHCGDSYVDDTVPANGHKFGDWYVTDEATCTENGEEKRECNNCDHFETAVINAPGHDHKSTVTPPTCTDRGYTTYTCHCGDSYVADYVKANGHDYDAVITPPDCINGGYTTYTCHCGDSYVDDTVPANGHKFGEWYVTDEATCTENGEEKRECNNCDHFETAVINALGHDHKSTVTPPTCTDRGYTTYTCHCGDSYVADYVNAKGHDYDAAVTPPTCTAQGYTTYTCHCGDSYKDDYTDELGHLFVNYESQGDATCLNDGTKIASCEHEGCKEKSVVTDINTAKGHTPEDEWVVVTPAKLGIDGKKQLSCSECHDVIAEEVIPALHYSHYEEWISDNNGHWYGCGCGCNKKFDYSVHTPGVWETTVPAGVDSEGKKELHCTTCNHLLGEQSIPAAHQSPDGAWHFDATSHWQQCACGEKLISAVHTPDVWKIVLEAGIGTEGKKELRCEICNALMDEEIIPALENPSVKYLRGDINLNGKIDSRDYMLLKRAYFGTYKLNEIATLVADVNNNCKVDSRDYLMLKRVYFGTSAIAPDNKFVTFP